MMKLQRILKGSVYYDACLATHMSLIGDKFSNSEELAEKVTHLYGLSIVHYPFPDKGRYFKFTQNLQRRKGRNYDAQALLHLLHSVSQSVIKDIQNRSDAGEFSANADATKLLVSLFASYENITSANQHMESSFNADLFSLGQSQQAPIFLSYCIAVHYPHRLSLIKSFLAQGPRLYRSASRWEPNLSLVHPLAQYPSEEGLWLMKAVLDHGASMNEENSDGNMPLQLAINATINMELKGTPFQLSLEHVKTLIQAGCELDIPESSTNLTALETVQSFSRFQSAQESYTAVMKVIERSLPLSLKCLAAQEVAQNLNRCQNSRCTHKNANNTYTTDSRENVRRRYLIENHLKEMLPESVLMDVLIRRRNCLGRTQDNLVRRQNRRPNLQPSPFVAMWLSRRPGRAQNR